MSNHILSFNVIECVVSSCVKYSKILITLKITCNNRSTFLSGSICMNSVPIINALNWEGKNKL